MARRQRRSPLPLAPPEKTIVDEKNLHCANSHVLRKQIAEFMACVFALRGQYLSRRPMRLPARFPRFVAIYQLRRLSNRVTYSAKRSNNLLLHSLRKQDSFNGDFFIAQMCTRPMVRRCVCVCVCVHVFMDGSNAFVSSMVSTLKICLPFSISVANG